MAFPAWFRADWPAPDRVRTAITLRAGGVSEKPYDTMNLALHVGDAPAHVLENRQRLQAWTGVTAIQWLRQVHGTDIVAASSTTSEPEADGVYSVQAGIACAVLTADCLPILICDREGEQVAAIHAGWRGLTAGILGRAIAQFDVPPTHLLVYLGPAISGEHYEVDRPVVDVVRQQTSLNSQPEAWERVVIPSASRPGHYQLDLVALARFQLTQCGAMLIYGGENCTYRQSGAFYSYRREAVTGRFASLIWLED